MIAKFFTWLTSDKIYDVDPDLVSKWAKDNYDEKLSDIAEKIAFAICSQTGINISVLSKETKFISDLAADGFDSIRFVFQIEEAFQFEIPDEDAENISYFDQLVQYIYEKKHKS